MREGGLFRADFLVVTAANYPSNTLQGVQRQRWSPGLIAGTLDIGYDVLSAPLWPHLCTLALRACAASSSIHHTLIRHRGESGVPSTPVACVNGPSQ